VSLRRRRVASRRGRRGGLRDGAVVVSAHAAADGRTPLTATTTAAQPTTLGETATRTRRAAPCCRGRADHNELGQWSERSTKGALEALLLVAPFNAVAVAAAAAAAERVACEREEGGETLADWRDTLIAEA
jgi:hypothetical protein